jgi:hypothetical protein
MVSGYADGQAFSTGVRRKDGHDDGDLTSAATADKVEIKVRGFGSVDSGMFRWLSGVVLVDPVSPGLERLNSVFTESGSGHHDQRQRYRLGSTWGISSPREDSRWQ